jgi:hypothetical protein
MQRKKKRRILSGRGGEEFSITKFCDRPRG